MAHQIYRGVSSVINDCNLVDIPIEGYQFTWVKSRGTEHMIEERLDRALTDTDWLQLFPNAKLLNLIASHSDHSLIMLDCEPKPHVKRKFTFRFENKWLSEDGIKKIAQDGWKVGEVLEVENRIAMCPDNLGDWDRNRGREERLEMV
ncbi:uncharacterized protein LOC131659521 [Vicia villosa]|uniref:uncharacterized protein LOC131659521 n=1 Tax=Vicia villosa TaxID=3911 RepID=UPI00273B6CB7|nr:uncharacterized protein LOC131659521 [Vicia villosa]